MSIEVPSTLEEAAIAFSAFLVKNGYPPNIIWISYSDLIFRSANLAYIRNYQTVAGVNAASLYFNAVQSKSAIALEAHAADDRHTFAEVWSTADETEIRYRMMSREVLKFSAPANQREAICVNSNLRWALLTGLYARGWCTTMRWPF
jgi:hypothetical protein